MAINDIFQAVLAFDSDTVKAKTQAELDAGTDIQTKSVPMVTVPMPLERLSWSSSWWPN